jgi:glucose/arabinose dehydrogenase
MVRRLPALVVPALVLALVVVAPPAEAQDPSFTPVVTDLGFATNVAVAPDGRMFVAEKDRGEILDVVDGRVRDEPFAVLPVTGGGETGLLGLALHPDFPDEPWLYAYFSDSTDGMNRIVRMRADEESAGPPQEILTLLPTANGYHNGGDMAFGPDGKLYVAVGEVHEADRAQDPNDLGGKILRLNPDGSVPEDNPFGPDNPAFAMGIRNSFGLCFDPEGGDLWETENGPDRFDEVNRIGAGGNYGWPTQLGPGGEPTFIDPVLAYETVIVPTGCAVSDGRLWFGTYGGDLHEVEIDDRPPADSVVVTFPSGITDVARASDGALYVVTTDTIYLLGAGVSISGTPTPSARAPAVRNPAFPSGGGIVIGLILIVALVLARSRLLRDR